MKRFLKGLSVFLLVGTLVGCDNDASTPPAAQQPAPPVMNENTNDDVEKAEVQDAEESMITFGSTFYWDDFEIVVGAVEEVSVWNIDNQFSDRNGEREFGIPVTITNHSGETRALSSFEMTTFNPSGVESSDFPWFDMDYGITWVDVRNGATANGYFVIPFEGNGYYWIEFNEFLGQGFVELQFPITLD